MTEQDNGVGVAQEGLAAETELKFELGPNDLRRLARHPALAQEAGVKRLVSTYYDTPDFDLRKAGVSVRVRKANDHYTQTVKRGRSADVFDRDEWEADVPGPGPLLEALEATPAAKVLKRAHADLQPVFATTIERATRLWTNGEAAIEISVDHGQIKVDADRRPIRELELELKAGEPRALYALARELSDLAPVRLSLTSKGDRGYRLASPAAPRRQTHPPLLPEMSVAEAFSAVLRSCLVHIVTAADDFRDKASAECIHQTRVGVRRTRTALKIFQPAVEDDQTAALDAELRWLAGELGPARSLDVFQHEMFAPEAVSDPETAGKYGRRLEETRKAAYDRAAAALNSAQFSRLTLELALWVEDGAWWRTHDPARRERLDSPIGVFAVDALDRLRRGLHKRGGDLAVLDVDARHKLRIRAKRLRYATEFFARALGEHGRRRRRFAGALKALQASLGRLNDIAQAGRVARLSLGGSGSPPLNFAAGELAGWARSHEPEVLAEAASAYTVFAAAKPFWPRSKRKGEPPQDEAPSV